MSVNDQQMLDTDQPVPPSPVLADPAPPAAQPDTTPVAHSDYGSLRVCLVQLLLTRLLLLVIALQMQLQLLPLPAARRLRRRRRRRRVAATT